MLVLGSWRRVCRQAGPGGLSAPVLEVWLALPLSLRGTLKLPTLLPELSFLQFMAVIIPLVYQPQPAQQKIFLFIS